MTRSVELAGVASPPVVDPTDAIIDFAVAIGATSIAADARRMAARFDSARLFVAVVGRPATVRAITRRMFETVAIPHDARAVVRFGRLANARATYRDGTVHVIPRPTTEQLPKEVATIDWFVDAPLLRRGVCITTDSLGPPACERRVDLIVTGKADAVDVSRHWPQTALVVDPENAGDIDEAIACIEGLATESGSAAVEDRVANHHRQLCTRLGHHLVEQQRALLRSPTASLARINALAIARMLAESAADARIRRPDRAREALTSWFSTERTKFLMASKADALAALDDRVSRSNRPRHQLRGCAEQVSHAIAVELLLQFWRRTSPESDKPIAMFASALLADLEGSLGDLGETLSPHALAGFDAAPIRGLRVDLEWPTPSRIVSQIVDSLGLASRRRIMAAARDSLVDALTTGSRRVVERALLDYDEACSFMERRFCDLVDSAIESVQVAAALAQAAQVGGPDQVARARHRIARLSLDLAELAVRLE